MAKVDLAELEAVCRSWPTPESDRARLRALLLRIRIERVVEGLPDTIIMAAPASRRLEHRLRLSVGEPGLDAPDRARRLQVISAAIAAYRAVCDLLHGRNPDPNPPLQDVKAWTEAVGALERELDTPA